MKKLLLVAFSLCFAAGLVQAQQDPLYSQYLTNPLLLNPAYAGLNNNFNAALSYRSQWGAFEGNPTTANLNGHISLVGNRVGVGVMLIQDELGNTENTHFMGMGSYKLQLQDKVISFGMQAGVINFQSDNGSLNLADPSDPAFAQNESLTKVNIGAGVILKSERYFVGFSVPRLLNSTFKSSQGESFDLFNQHYYLLGGYVFYLNERFRFRPSVLFKGVSGSPLSTDLNFNLNIDQKYSAGLYTRNFNTYGVLLQALFNDKFTLGYSFELPTDDSIGTRFNTHEVTLGVRMSVLSFHERSISNF